LRHTTDSQNMPTASTGPLHFLPAMICVLLLCGFRFAPVAHQPLSAGAPVGGRPHRPTAPRFPAVTAARVNKTNSCHTQTGRQEPPVGQGARAPAFINSRCRYFGKRCPAANFLGSNLWPAGTAHDGAPRGLRVAQRRLGAARVRGGRPGRAGHRPVVTSGRVR
jgi:hypothetical protein